MSQTQDPRSERQGGAVALMVAPEGACARALQPLLSPAQLEDGGASWTLPADAEALAPGSPRPDDAFSVHSPAGSDTGFWYRASSTRSGQHNLVRVASAENYGSGLLQELPE